MEKEEDQTPLQEVVYKPTTESSSLAALKAEPKPTSLFLYFSAAIAGLISFTCGTIFGWSSPVLPKLTSTDDPDINPLGRIITNTEESWIAGLIPLGAIFGPFIAGFAADRLGRKKTLILSAFPLLVSYLVLAYAKTILVYYIFRLIMGVGVGATFTVLPMYLAEISEDHNRGTLGCSLGVLLSVGFLYVFAIGPYVTIRNLCLLCAVPLIISIPVFLIWIPETPHFLASANRNKDLQICLSKLRNKSPEEIQTEVAEITKHILEQAQNKGGFSDLFKMRSLRKGITIILGIMLLQQFSGINAVLAYMHNIFNATGSGISSAVSTIIVALIQVVTTVAASFLVERLGRRILLLTSSIGSCISLVSLGLYFYLKTNGYKVDTLSWLPISSILLYIIAFNIGLGPLPWAVMAELFSSNVRSVAAALTSTTGASTSFIITTFFPALALVLGMAKTFWIFALVCLGGTVFINFMLPETKGRSLKEIQRLLEGRKT